MAKIYRSTLFQKLFASRAFQISGVLLVISYVLLILSSANIIDLNNYKITYKTAIYIVTIIIVLFSVSTTMFTYLQGSKKINEENRRQIDSIELKTQLRRLEILIEEQRYEFYNHVLDLEQKKQESSVLNFSLEEDESINELRQKIKNAVNKDFIDDLNHNIANGFVSERSKSIEEIRGIEEKISERLRGEIDKLDRKSDINLIIGSLTTVVAFIALAIVVFGQSGPDHSLNNILYHYIPRISFIVFIEVFAFFFLRLYKLNINDIKYYQNELTNIEIKILSVISSVKFGLKEDVSAIVVELSKAERNFILEKGQTTIEFEKFKYENNSLDKFTKLLKNVLPKLK